MREHSAAAGTETLPTTRDEIQEHLYEEPIITSSRQARAQPRVASWVSEFSASTNLDSFSSSSSTRRDSCLAGYSPTPRQSRFRSFTPSSGASSSARSSVNSSALSRTSYQWGFWKVRFLRPPSVFTVNKETQSEA